MFNVICSLFATRKETRTLYSCTKRVHCMQVIANLVWGIKAEIVHRLRFVAFTFTDSEKTDTAVKTYNLGFDNFNHSKSININYTNTLRLSIDINQILN
jgi:hypothetical protein